MIEKMDYASDYNMAAMWIKLNEIIDVLNKLTAPGIAKAKEEKVLWINKNHEVIEFCCDELKECIIYYDICLFEDYEKGTIKAMLETKKIGRADKLILKRFENCPYCGASIKCKTSEEPIREKRVRITLTGRDANKLRNHIHNMVLDASIRRGNTLDATMRGEVYQHANKILQFYMRIRAEIDRKEVIEN